MFWSEDHTVGCAVVLALRVETLVARSLARPNVIRLQDGGIGCSPLLVRAADRNWVLGARYKVCGENFCTLSPVPCTLYLALYEGSFLLEDSSREERSRSWRRKERIADAHDAFSAEERSITLCIARRDKHRAGDADGGDDEHRLAVVCSMVLFFVRSRRGRVT